MFNINFYVKRRDDVSRSEFLEFWHGQHAVLLKDFAEALGVRALIKNEMLLDHPVGIESAKAYGTGPIRYDAVDTWKFNDIEALRTGAALEHVQAGLKRLAHEEDRFVDVGASNVEMTVDLAQFYPPDAMEIRATPDSSVVKIFFVARCLDGLTRAQAQLHWNASHGGVSRQDVKYSVLSTYLQCHSIPSTFVDQLVEQRGYDYDPALIGHAEGWIDTAQPPKDFPEDVMAEVVSMSMDDIDLFADKDKGNVFVCHEHYVIDKQVIVRPMPKFFGATY